MVYTRSQARRLSQIMADMPEEVTPQEGIQGGARSEQQVEPEAGPGPQTSGGNFGVGGTSLLPFRSIPVDNREYSGFIINEDLGKEEIQIKFRDHFWDYLKRLTGSVIRVKVQPLEMKDAEKGYKAMQFLVCNYATVRDELVNQELASVDIVSKPGVGSTFKFHIINSALAADNRVDLSGLIATCEDVFSTLLIRHPGPTVDEWQKLVLEKIAKYERSNDEVSSDGVSTDEMSTDEVSTDEMSTDEMSIDENEQ